jgi:hypothetical protein
MLYYYGIFIHLQRAYIAGVQNLKKFSDAIVSLCIPFFRAKTKDFNVTCAKEQQLIENS